MAMQLQMQLGALVSLLLAASPCAPASQHQDNATHTEPLEDAASSNSTELPDDLLVDVADNASTSTGRPCATAVCRAQCRKANRETGKCQLGGCHCKDRKPIKARNIETHINYNVNQNVNFNTVAQFPFMMAPPFPAQPVVQPSGGQPGGQPVRPGGQPVQPGGQPAVQPGGQPAVQPGGQPVQPGGQPIQPGGQPGVLPGGQNVGPGGQTGAPGAHSSGAGAHVAGGTTSTPHGILSVLKSSNLISV